MSTKSGTGDRGEAKEGWAGGPNRPRSDHPHTGTSTFPVTGEELPGLVPVTPTPPLARASKASPKWFYPPLLHPHLLRLLASLFSSSSTFFCD